MPSSGVRKANKLTECLLQDASSPYSVRVTCAGDLTEDERHNVWTIFEANMRDLYTRSSFGWEPKGKRKELFHRHSRFLMVLNGIGLTAFSMFRFDIEESEEVLYCYELQVSSVAQRAGLGTMMMQQLIRLGSLYHMKKVMLTVQKENIAAFDFYKKLGFAVDGWSPSKFGEEVDYEIMSCNLYTGVC